MSAEVYPFSAVVGQERLKTALIASVVDPRIGGVVIRGQKGTAKSTAVRALRALLPDIDVSPGCAFHCEAGRAVDVCEACAKAGERTTVPTPLVELPIGAGEDRLVGSLDVEAALKEGRTAFQPGLLASANRGLLYVDEVNLLDDHLVDVLLDAAAMGVNRIEREGVSLEHPARFSLVGTMNAEEGELRPQLLDRFGLSVVAGAPADPAERSEVVRRRMRYEAGPESFVEEYSSEEKELAARIAEARANVGGVALSDRWLLAISRVCAAFEVDGLRADIVTSRTAIALAAWNGVDSPGRPEVREACLLALPHRRRRGPFDDMGIDEDELDRLLDEVEPPEPEEPEDGPEDPDDGPDDGGDDDGDDGSDRTPPPPQSRQEPEQQSPPPPENSPANESTDQAPSQADGPAAQEQIVSAAPAGRVARLSARARGIGAAGRRSRGATPRGAAVRSRPCREGESPRRGDLAVASTITAWVRRGKDTPLSQRDYRVFDRAGKQGHLIVLCVDASGSMGARKRMAAVKGAVRSLLLDAYQRRDAVSLVTFRGKGAAAVLPPTSSVDVADRSLRVLATGGRTPLGEGLIKSFEVIERHRRKDPLRRPLLVVVTDGRTNSGRSAERASEAIARQGVPGVVIDSESGFVRTGGAGSVAEDLGMKCVRLEEFASETLSRTIELVAGR
ncbi:magnesium chelatase subunit D family protein [Salininema proteolyticum]|uniref:Mg-protoporphyrin IX chelatase n=1 Tax=Salininema proteolyticum TaxID=1607685 RepID=A0ABV8U640_9ACTN